MTTRAVVLERVSDRIAGEQLAATPVCGRAGFRPESGRLTLWDGQGATETVAHKRSRQASALRLCNLCPAVASCRQWLEDADRNGVLVDGVVAGTVRTWRRSYRGQ